MIETFSKVCTREKTVSLSLVPLKSGLMRKNVHKGSVQKHF